MLPISQGTVCQIFFLICVILLIDESKSEARVVCYYTNWSVYRPGTAKFNPQNINPYLCTHLIYAFGGFTKDNTLKPFDKYQDIEQGGYAKFTGLKSYNKNLKTLLAIGGWNEASSRFSPLVANPDRRQQFIKNILKFLRQNHFDGLDLDWEYPAHRDGGKARDKDNYAQFVQELRAEFDRESSKTGRPRLLVTMAVPAGIEYIEKGYDIPKLNKYLDWFNILSYDYHSAYEPSVNHHAPLYSLEDDSEYNYDGELNIDYTVKFYLNAGAEKDKLVLGIPTYGRSYTLINEESTEIGSPSDGPGEQGDATREKGYLAYYEICQNIRDDADWQVTQPNPKAMGPYAYKDNQWVGYDDEAMVRKKGEYVAENGLGGIMFWSIDNDDFRGLCTGKPYPLIEAAKEALLDHLRIDTNEVSKPSNTKKQSRSKSRKNSTNRNRISSTVSIDKDIHRVSTKNPTRRPAISRKRTTTTSTSPTTTSSLYIGRRTTTPEPPTTPDPGSDFKCEEEGFFQHPRDCKKYFWCLDSGPSNLGIVAHQFTCPSGLYFNPAADSCDFSRNVLCNQKSTKNNPTTTTTSKLPTTTTVTTNRPKITAATSRNSFRYSSPTTTTTEYVYDYDDDVVEDDDEEEVQHGKVHDDIDSEEDPKVIKELIDLLKKVGGIEELEKLLQQDGEVMSLKTEKKANTSTTETPISKSLYDKVLRRPSSLKSFKNQFNTLKLQTNLHNYDSEEEKTDMKTRVDKIDNKYSSIVRNGRPSPQNDGIDKLSEFSGFRKEKPKYVTITRTTPSKSNAESVLEDGIDYEIANEDDVITKADDEIRTKHKTVATTPAYKSILRVRPITTQNTTSIKVVTAGDTIRTENSPNKNKSHHLFKNRYNDNQTIEPNYEENKNLLSSHPARVNIIQQNKKTINEYMSMANYENNDEPISTVTVHNVDHIENTTLLPTKHNIFTTTRVYSNFSRKTTESHPIKLSVENLKAKQESQSNSLNASVITPTTQFPLTIEPITTTINDIPTINITPINITNPLQNKFVSNTTFMSILQNSTEFYGNTPVSETKETENNFDETETKQNTTDEVLFKNRTKDNNVKIKLKSGSFNTTVENSRTNNININHSSSDILETSTIKLYKTETEKTNLDNNKTREFHNTRSKSKPFDFVKGRVRPTTHKSLIISKSDISDSLSSTENEISTKEVSFLSPFNHTNKNISMNTNVDLNLRSIVDSTKVKGEIKNLDDSLKSAHISHRKMLFNNKLIESIETPSIVSKTYSWKDARIGNFRPWHNKLKTITNSSIEHTTNRKHQGFTYASEETHNSGHLNLTKVNMQQYMNHSNINNSFRKYRPKTNQSIINKNITEQNAANKQETKMQSKILKQYSFLNESDNLNSSVHTSKNNSGQSTAKLLDYNKRNQTSETRNYIKNLNNSLINKTSLNLNFNKDKYSTHITNNLNKQNNNNNMVENSTINNSNIFINNRETNLRGDGRNNKSTTSSTQIYNQESKMYNSENTYVEDKFPSNSNTEKNDGASLRPLTLNQFETNTVTINQKSIGNKNYDYNKIMMNISASGFPIKFDNGAIISTANNTTHTHRNDYNETTNNTNYAETVGADFLIIQNKNTFAIGSDIVLNSELNRNDSLNKMRLNTTKATLDDNLIPIQPYIQDKPGYKSSYKNESHKIPSSGIAKNDKSTIKYSPTNRLLLKTTTESTHDDLQVIRDQTTSNTKIKNNSTLDLVLNTRPFKTTKSPDDLSRTAHYIQDKVVYNSSSNGSNDGQSLKYSERSRLRLKTTTDSVGDLPLMQDQIQQTVASNSTKISKTKINDNSTEDFTLKRLRLKTTTESPDDELSGTEHNIQTESEYNSSSKGSSNKYKYSDGNTTNSVSADFTISQDQAKETFDSNNAKTSKTQITHDSIQEFKLNRPRFKTTTESANDDLSRTEHYIMEKEVYDSNSKGSNNRYSLKYTERNILRLKTTTELVDDKFRIIQDQTQDTFDANTAKIRDDSIQDSISNRQRLKPTTESADVDISRPKHYNHGRELYNSSSNGSNDRYSLKYTERNRLRIKTTTNSLDGNLKNIQDQRQFDSNSAKISKTKINQDSTKGFTLNRGRFKTTTESPNDDLSRTEAYSLDEEMYDGNSNSVTNTYSLKYSAVNRLRLETTTESLGADLTIIQNQAKEIFGSNSGTISNTTINKDSIQGLSLNKHLLKETTETPHSKLASTETLVQDRDSNVKYSLKYSEINRLRLKAPIESEGADLTANRYQTQKTFNSNSTLVSNTTIKEGLTQDLTLNKHLLKATTETPEDNLERTETHAQDKDVYDRSSTDSNEKYSLRYFEKNGLPLKTTTESIGTDVTISQIQTPEIFDSNSGAIRNTTFNEDSTQSFTLNKQQLKANIETRDDTVKQVQDKYAFNSSSTGAKDQYSLKYTEINRLRLKATTESLGADLKNSQNQAQNTFNSNSTLKTNTTINEDSAQDLILNKHLLKTTAETQGDNLAKTEMYVRNEDLFNSSSTGSNDKYSLKYSEINRLRLKTTTEPINEDLTIIQDHTKKSYNTKFATESPDVSRTEEHIHDKVVFNSSSNGSNDRYSLKYSERNRLKTTAETIGDHFTIIINQTQETLDTNTAKNSKTKFIHDSTLDVTLKGLPLKTTTESRDNDPSRTDYYMHNENENNSHRTASIDNYSLRYSTVNRLRLKTTTESIGADYIISQEEIQESVESNNAKVSKTKITNGSTQGLNKYQIKTHTETPVDDITRSEYHIQRKEGYDSSSKDSNNRYSLKYSEINGLKTTTEPADGDYTIIQDQVQRTLNTNEAKISKTKINHSSTPESILNRHRVINTRINNELTKKSTLNRLRLKTTTESPHDSPASTERNSVFTTASSNSRNSLKYLTRNRLQLKTTTQSTTDHLTIIEDYTQNGFDDNSAKVLNTKINDSTLNKLRLKTTPKDLDDTLISNVDYIPNKKVYDSHLAKNSSRILGTTTTEISRDFKNNKDFHQNKLVNTGNMTIDSVKISGSNNNNLTINNQTLQSTEKTEKSLDFNSAEVFSTASYKNDSTMSSNLNTISLNKTTVISDELVNYIENEEGIDSGVTTESVEVFINNNSSKSKYSLNNGGTNYSIFNTIQFKLATDPTIGYSETSSDNIQDEINYMDKVRISTSGIKNNTGSATNNTLFIQNITDSFNSKNIDAFTLNIGSQISIADSTIDNTTSINGLILAEKTTDIYPLVDFINTERTNEDSYETYHSTTESSKEYNIRKNYFVSRKGSATNKVRVPTTNKAIFGDSRIVKNDNLELESLSGSPVNSDIVAEYPKPLFSKDSSTSSKSDLQRDLIEEKTINSYSWRDARIGNYRPRHETASKYSEDEFEERKPKRILHNINVYKVLQSGGRDLKNSYISDKTKSDAANNVRYSDRRKIFSKEETLFTDDSTKNLNGKVNPNKYLTLSRYQLKTTTETTPDESKTEINYVHEQKDNKLQETNTVNQIKIPTTLKMPDETVFPSQLTNNTLFQSQRTLLKKKTFPDSVVDFANSTSNNISLTKKTVLDKSIKGQNNLESDIHKEYQNSTKKLQILQLFQVASNQSLYLNAENSTDSLGTSNTNVSSFLTTPIYPIFNRYRNKDIDNTKYDFKNINPQLNKSHIVDVVFKVINYTSDSNLEKIKPTQLPNFTELKYSVNNSFDNERNSDKAKYLRSGRLLNHSSYHSFLNNSLTPQEFQNYENNSLPNRNFSTSSRKKITIYKKRIILDPAKTTNDFNATKILHNAISHNLTEHSHLNRHQLNVLPKTKGGDGENTEDYIQDKQVFDSSLTTQPLAKSDSKDSNDRYSLKYAAINRVRLKTTSESITNDLTIEDSTQNSFGFKAAIGLNTRINNDYRLKKIRFRTTTEASNIEPTSTVDYVQSKKIHDNSQMMESDDLPSSISSNDIYSRRYSTINRHRFKTSTESIDDGATTFEDQTETTISSNSLKKLNSKISHDWTEKSTVKNFRFKTTTNSPDGVNTEDYTENKEVYDSRFTTESSNSRINNKYLLKYTPINRVGLKAITQSTGGDFILQQDQILNPLHIKTTAAISNEDRHLKTTTTTPDQDLPTTADIEDNGVVVSNLTVKIANKTLRLQTTTEIEDNLKTILDQTQGSFNNGSKQKSSLNASEATTEIQDDLKNTEVYNNYNEMNDSSITTEYVKISNSSSDNKNISQVINYTPIQELQFNTTNNFTNENIRLIPDNRQRDFSFNASKVLNNTTKNYSILRKLQVKTGTKAVNDEHESPVDYIQDKVVYDSGSSLTLDSDQLFNSNSNTDDSVKYSLKYVPSNGLQLKTTTESTDDALTDILDKEEKHMGYNSEKVFNKAVNKYTRLNRIHTKATTEASDDDHETTVDYIQDKNPYENSLTTESDILSSSNTANGVKYSLKYGPTRRLRLKTTTESAGDNDLTNIFDKEQKNIDNNSAKGVNSALHKYAKLNRIHINTTIEAHNGEPESAADYVEDKNFYKDDLTTESGKTATSNTRSGLKYTLKYAPINRLRLKTTTDFAGDALTNILGHEERNIVTNTRIIKDKKLNSIHIKPTTETPEPESSADYMQHTNNNDGNIESGKLSSNSERTGIKHSLKYTPINRLRFKTTTEFLGDDLTTIENQAPETFESNSGNLINLNMNQESRKVSLLNRLRLKPTTETPDDELATTLQENQPNEGYDNSFTTESVKISSGAATKNKYSQKYSTVNRLRLKTKTDLTNPNKQEKKIDKFPTQSSGTSNIDSNKVGLKKYSVLNRQQLTSKLNTTENYNHTRNLLYTINNNISSNDNSNIDRILETTHTDKTNYPSSNELLLKNSTESTNSFENNTMRLYNYSNRSENNDNHFTNITNPNTHLELSEITNFENGTNNITSDKHNGINIEYVGGFEKINTENIIQNINNARRFQKGDINSPRFNGKEVNITNALNSTTSNGRRIRVLKFKRPAPNSLSNNSITQINRTLLSNEFSNIDFKTQTEKIYTRKLIRKRPVTTISNHTDYFSTDNITQPITSTKHFRKVIKKVIRPLTNISETEVIISTTSSYGRIQTQVDNGTLSKSETLLPENLHNNKILKKNTFVRRRLYQPGTTATSRNDFDINISTTTSTNGIVTQEGNATVTTNETVFPKTNKSNTVSQNLYNNNSLETFKENSFVHRQLYQPVKKTTTPNDSNINIATTTRTNEVVTKEVNVTENETVFSKTNKSETVIPQNLYNNNKSSSDTFKENTFVRRRLYQPALTATTTNDSDINISTTSPNEIVTQEENVTENETVFSKTNKSEIIIPQNSYNNNTTSSGTIKENTFGRRRLYQPATTTTKTVFITTEESTANSPSRQLNKTYFIPKVKTIDTKNNISINRNITFSKIEHGHQTVQTYENKQSNDDDIQDYEEYDDEENDDGEDDDDETDYDKNDDEKNINDEQQENRKLDSPIVSISKIRDKIKSNYVGKLRNSSQDNLSRIQNKRPNFPTNYKKPNFNKQPFNALARRPTKRPRVINRPVFTTPNPTLNQIELTNFSPPTTPSVFRSKNTRTYERKYYPSSTENNSQETPQDNPLLDDLNIDALNARNKKIFEITSKKHTTAKPKPLLVEQLSIEKNTTNENDTQNNTTTNLNEHTELNNLNQLQDETTEHTTLQLSPKNLKIPINAEITTLKHIFAIDKEEQPTTISTVSDQSYHSENEGKLVEINRVIEISSQEQKRKPISGLNNANQNTNLKIETPSHVDKLGEISRVKFVQLVQSNLTQSNNSDRQYLENDEKNIIANGETESDYTTTESFSNQIESKRNSILYDNHSKQAYIKKGRQLVLPEVIRGVETSTIPLEGLFDSARKSKNLELINGPIFASSLGEIYATSTENDSILSTTEDTIIDIPTTQPFQMVPKELLEENTTIIVEGTTTPERNYNYVRPIVPLLRPESNESSPLVISIANLDKVILSKIPKTDSNIAYSAPISQVVEAPKSLKKDISVENGNNSSHARNNIIEEVLTSFSSETSIIKAKLRQSSHRPVLSVQRRLATVTNLPKYSSTNIVAEKVTTMLPLLDETTNLKYSRRTSSIYRSTTLRSNTELKTTPTHTRNYSNKPTHQSVNRRAYVRPEKRRSTTINLDNIDIETTTGESITLRNTNALFRRRYTFSTSTYSPNILTTIPTSTINIDQEAGSSIQDSKFINNKLIGRNFNVEENIPKSIKEISRVSFPDAMHTTPLYTEQNTSVVDFAELENKGLPNLKPNETNFPKNFTRPRTAESPKSLQTFTRSRRPQKIENNNYQFTQRTFRPIIDYDYYDEEDVRIVSKSNSLVKVILNGQGIIECLDQGNFPHPLSCRKFISCAKMGKDTEGAIGWEYTCPKGLSYDPVGGICNWASGLGCKE